MEISYERAIAQTEAEEGQEVTAAQRKWLVSEKSLAQYQVVKRSANQKSLKAYRVSRGIPLPKEVKEDSKRG